MTGQLKFGVTGINGGATSYPEALAGVAQTAERAGFDSLWAGEHHVLATSSTTIPATSRYLNPVVALTYAAAFTPFAWESVWCSSRSTSHSSWRRNWPAWMSFPVAA